MIKVNLHTDRTGLQNNIPLDQISDILEREDSLLWVDVVDPSPDDLRLIGQEFQFHPLAMEDSVRRHQRPKLDHYDGFVFIVFYGIDVEGDRPVTREINLFVGKNFLVTVHDGRLEAISETAQRWSDSVAQRGNNGIGLLVYSVIDAIVDGYFPVIDDLTERVQDLEEAIFERRRLSPHTQEEIFSLKKDLLAVQRVLGPERDVMNVLVRRDAPLFGEEQILYFQDVYDHLLRVADAVDQYRDLLTGALDAYVSVESQRLNEVVKTLTSSSIILMSMTLVASIYGMNFIHMPELGWHLGYAWALSLMMLIGAGLVVVFRRIDWL